MQRTNVFQRWNSGGQFIGFALSCLVTIAMLPDRAICDELSEGQLAKWLKRFPAADTNGDGKLSQKEADQFRKNYVRRGKTGRQSGPPKEFQVDAGWQQDRFPDHAVSHKPAKEIASIYGAIARGKAFTSYPKPTDGSLRIVGTGHSFMAPGYNTLPLIARMAGLKQPPLVTHVGGGMTGSARYKWEQENGIFQFDGKPRPKLLASISNAKWDAMMWGPYYNDRAEYYSCWIDFCLKYNPEMKFFLADAWPQLGQLSEVPKSEDELTNELMQRLEKEKYDAFSPMIRQLNKTYDNRVFVMPTSKAMVIAVREFRKGNLPGIEGIHQVVGRQPRSLWKDKLGHLGPGLEDLEGYVFYSTLYGRSAELIERPLRQRQSEFPSAELDTMFRRIAWEAITSHPLSGVIDADKDGVNDIPAKALSATK